MRFISVSVMISCLALSACATLKQPTDKASEPAPKLIETLPEDIGSFEYEGYRYFEDSSNGYTIRYANPKKRRLADVYIYPVATQNENLDHEDLVMGSTRATIQAIAGAVKQGIYDNFNLVGAATQARGFRTVARVEATYLSDNLASYTLVYQTLPIPCSTKLLSNWTNSKLQSLLKNRNPDPEPKSEQRLSVLTQPTWLLR